MSNGASLVGLLIVLRRTDQDSPGASARVLADWQEAGSDGLEALTDL